jgi:hypothetical protein
MFDKQNVFSHLKVKNISHLETAKWSGKAAFHLQGLMRDADPQTPWDICQPEKMRERGLACWPQSRRDQAKRD